MPGAELNALQSLIGVPEDVLKNESALAELELFLVLRVKASSKSRGVPCMVKLQLANDSLIVRKTPLIEFSTLFPDELQMRIIKIHSLGDSRDGATGMGASSGKMRLGIENDLVEKLHKGKPLPRLRSMITK